MNRESDPIDADQIEMDPSKLASPEQRKEVLERANAWHAKVTGQVTVNLPRAVVEALQRRAKAEGRTIGDVLRESICKEMDLEGA